MNEERRKSSKNILDRAEVCSVISAGHEVTTGTVMLNFRTVIQAFCCKSGYNFHLSTCHALFTVILTSTLGHFVLITHKSLIARLNLSDGTATQSTTTGYAFMPNYQLNFLYRANCIDHLRISVQHLSSVCPCTKEDSVLTSYTITTSATTFLKLHANGPFTIKNGAPMEEIG